MEDKKKLESEIISLKQRISLLDSAIQSKRQMDVSLTSQINDNTKTIESLKNEIELIKSKRDELSVQLKDVKEELVNASSQLNKSKSQHSLIMEESERNKIEQEILIKKNLELMKDIKSREQKIILETANLEKQKKEIKSLEISAFETYRANLEYKKSLEDMEKNLHNKEEKMNVVIANLDEERKTLERDKYGFSSHMSDIVEKQRIMEESISKSSKLQESLILKIEEAEKEKNLYITKQKSLDASIAAIKNKENKLLIKELNLVKLLDEKNTEEALKLLKESLKNRSDA